MEHVRPQTNIKVTQKATLNGFLYKEPKFEKCAQCQHFGKKYCILGYATTANSKPCHQGTLRSRQNP